MENLNEIIEKINSLWRELDKAPIEIKIVNDILKNSIDIKQNINHIPKQFGLYMFFIKPKEKYASIEMLENDWIDDEFSKYPKIIKTRFASNIENEDWIPFYLGKSEKVGERIGEHLNHHKMHATYGLKLKERIDFKLKNEIKVGYWVLPVDDKTSNEIKQFIITNFERELRKRLNPWVGKQ